MNIRTLQHFFVLGVLCLPTLCIAKINFGSKGSNITIENDSIFKAKNPGMVVQAGGLNRKEQGIISGYPIRFDRGIFSSFNSSSEMSGVFDSFDVGTLILGENPNPDDLDIIISNPGGLPHQLLVKPGAHFLRGQPLFFGPNDIALTDETTVLAIAIQNALNTNITMNGGILFLQDDLSLGDDSVLLGDGIVVFNNRRLSLGGKESFWTGNIIWNSALDMQLNSRTTLQGAWIFFADGQINGNGNVLDIANGGTIVILPDSRLRLSGVRLKGLGSGSILMGDNAELRLSDVEIEMDASYLVNSGGIYVDGNTNIITKDNLLTITDSFDSHGSLTVDRVGLTYDPLSFIDNLNIRPLRIQDPNHKFIEIINNGGIRLFRQESISFRDYSSNTAMQRYAIISPQRPMRVFPEINQLTNELVYTFTVQGVTNFLGFTRANEPIMFISDDVNITYQDVVFREFSPVHLSMGNNATLIFGDKTTIQLPRDDVLNYTMVFEGTTFLKGGGAILTLDTLGAIELRSPNGVLLIENVTIKGLSGNKIRCLDPSSKIIFKNVKLIQDGDFTFDTGSIDVLGDLAMVGPFSFNYFATGPFRILSDATLLMSRGKIFTYAPTNGDRTLFQMVDSSSTIDINEVTISAPAQGLQLINGRLIVQNRNFLQNDGGSSAADGIVFGNGNSANNVIVQRSGDATLEVISGFFEDQNVVV